MPISARQLVSDVSHMVPLPATCLHMAQTLESPTASAMDIADIIAQDPALTARLLKIANSPYYGFPSKVDTLSRAITIVGTQDLYQLVLAMSAIDTVNHAWRDQDAVKNFWRHSLMTGLVARDLARRSSTPVMHVERMFVAGLLHDIGAMVMAIRIPELSKVMLRCAEKLDMSITQAERNVFDLDHGQVGAELMAEWALPKMLQNVARHHHEPELCDADMLEVSIVHIANWASESAMFSRFNFEYDELLSDSAMSCCGISLETVSDSVEAVRSEFDQIEGSFFSADQQRKAG